MAEADKRKRTIFTSSADRASDYLKQFEERKKGMQSEVDKNKKPS